MTSRTTLKLFTMAALLAGGVLVSAQQPLLPKGTVIHVTAWYDNTRGNKNNPDPEQWVGYGDRTVDEMAHAWMNVVYFNDEEFKALQSERKAKLTNNDNEKQQ